MIPYATFGSSHHYDASDPTNVTTNPEIFKTATPDQPITANMGGFAGRAVFD
jgi:hypothetical protein